MSVFEFSLKTWNGKEFITSMIEKLGLEEGGRVQQMVDSEFLKNVEPFVPFDEAGLYENPGTLVNSGILDTVVGSGEIVWDTPYARYLYYHDDFQFQGAPLRGAYWADRYLQNGGLKQIEAIAGKSMDDKIIIDGLKLTPYQIGKIKG
jgi:hypothetical protein